MQIAECQLTGHTAILDSSRQQATPDVLYWSHGWVTQGWPHSTGNPNVTVSWPGGHSILLDAGQTLIIKAEGSFNVEWNHSVIEHLTLGCVWGIWICTVRSETSNYKTYKLPKYKSHHLDLTWLRNLLVLVCCHIALPCNTTRPLIATVESYYLTRHTL